MARKKKIQIEKYPGIPRGSEHLPESAWTRTDPETGELVKVRHPRLDALGREVSDPLPIALPLRRESVFTLEQIRAARQLAEDSTGPLEEESFEEANDFELDDDFGEFVSAWEQTPDDLLAIEEYKRFRATGEIPQHMLDTIERRRARQNRPPISRHNMNPQPDEGKPSSGARPAEGNLPPNNGGGQ